MCSPVLRTRSYLTTKPKAMDQAHRKETAKNGEPWKLQETDKKTSVFKDSISHTSNLPDTLCLADPTDLYDL